MFAINHAAASLAVKKKFPKAKMLWLLISVQFIEILWVIFNFLGIEITETDKVVNYVGNIHLIHMPFSHSILSSIILALLSYVIIKYVVKENNLALPFAIGLFSHIVLDIITHAKDIPLYLLADNPKIGTELYTLFPYIAFILELAFGVWCWWYFKGNKSLLIIILLFNAANFTVFSPDIIGLEKYFANNEMLLVSVIAVQIIVTLILVGHFYKSKSFSFIKIFSFNKW
jgi:membrane-bound metal-dependent hydrolase YbcI (DUF457 family)